jgi:hypothetical protein
MIIVEANELLSLTTISPLSIERRICANHKYVETVGTQGSHFELKSKEFKRVYEITRGLRIQEIVVDTVLRLVYQTSPRLS